MRTMWVRDVMLTISVIARWKEAMEKAAAEQQNKEEGREKLAGAAWRKGAKKAPALAEPWGGPGMECNTCHDTGTTCIWPSGITKRIHSCECCQGQKARCKIDGALDPRSWVLKPKLVQQGDRTVEGHLTKKHWMDAEVQAEGSRVGTRGVATRVGAIREPLANTTVGKLIWLVAAQSEHMARLEKQGEKTAEGLERQMIWIGDQLERMAGVMERSERSEWSVRRANRLPEEGLGNGMEQGGADPVEGPVMIIN
jgi:hypothetical protein